MLYLLGTFSFIFVVAFTYHAYFKEHTIGAQSPKSAILEAWFNILVGFGVNFAANIWLLPLVGAEFNHLENFFLGWIYTAISIVRQYSVRRWFNKRIHEAAVKLSEQ